MATGATLGDSKNWGLATPWHRRAVDILVRGAWNSGAQADGEDAQAFDRWMRDQGLWHLWAWHAKAGAGESHIAKNVAENARDELRAALAVCLYREAELQDLSERLEARGLRSILLKGAVVEHLLYPAPYLRPRCDLDLFVDEADTDAVHETLREAGYRLRRSSNHSFLGSSFNYRKMEGGLEFDCDIHWKIHNNPRMRDALSFEDVYTRGRIFDKRYPSLKAPCISDLLFHASLHFGADVGHMTLRQSWEIRALCELLSEQDFTSFVQRVAGSGLTEDCRLSLATAYRVLDVGPEHSWVSEWLREEIQYDACTLLDKQELRRLSTTRLARLRNAKSLRQQIALVVSECFPHPRYVKNNLSAPLKEYPGIYLQRLIFGAVRNASQLVSKKKN